MNQVAVAGSRARHFMPLVGLAIMVAGAFLAHRILTAGGVRVIDVRFVGSDGASLSGLLHIPPGATAATPAPGVLAVHGYFNSRETQGNFAVEFARRGYVVLALDQRGHGHSDPPAFVAGFGGPDGLRFLRSLAFVDKDNIGLEGHSMGGWAVVNAAAAEPDGYRAVVLEGSSTGAPFAPTGTADFPRNLAVVFSKFDEFASTMWGAALARDVPRSDKLKQQFGTSEAVVPGRLYGSIEAGTGRMLYQPGGTHPWDHQSRAAIGDAVDWFQRSLKGGTPLPVGDQIWAWKEVGTTFAMVGLVVLILGLCKALLALPCLAPLNSPPAPAAAARTGRWWATLTIGALLPAITLFPFMQLGSRFVPATAWLPQAFSNEILVWALLNAALIAAASYLPGGPASPRKVSVARAAALGALAVGGAYVAVVCLNALWHVDLRFWFVALRPMATGQVSTFVIYAIALAGFFAVVLRALHANLSLARQSAATEYVISIVALTGGYILLLALQYGLLFSGRAQLTFFMNDGLRTIIAINFVPLMSAVAVISTFLWRRTGTALPGAMVSAVLVAWYLVVGQATQSAG